MNEPIRTQWQIRCAFNGFCKLALKREAMNAHRDTKQRQLREVTFSDLSPLEENQLYVCDKYFADDEAEQSFVVGGKEITAKLLAEALHSLPEEKRETVLLYYFFDMSEREIAKFCNLSRTTVQSRRTSSMKLLKRYLEERAYDCTDLECRTEWVGTATELLTEMREQEVTPNMVTKYLGQFACEVLEPLGIEYRTKRTGKSRLIKFLRRDGDDANDAGIAI